MTNAYWCVLIAIILPYVWAMTSKMPSVKQGAYDNNSPRKQAADYEGVSLRASWAQANSWEALPGFAIAVIIAHLAAANQATIDMIAYIFIVARILYGVSYIKDWATLRSAVWTIGFGCIIALFVVSA